MYKPHTRSRYLVNLKLGKADFGTHSDLWQYDESANVDTLYKDAKLPMGEEVSVKYL